MKPNTSNLGLRLEALTARAKEATRLFNQLGRAKHQAQGFADQVKAINTDGLPENSPVLKLKARTEEKRKAAVKEFAELAEKLAVELDGPLGNRARETLLDLEGTSGTGAAELYASAPALALHDMVFSDERLSVEVRDESLNLRQERGTADATTAPLAT